MLTIDYDKNSGGLVIVRAGIRATWSDLPLPDWIVTESAMRHIRQVVDGPPTNEAPWAAAERALDEAQAAKRIYRWIYWPAWPGNCNQHEYAIQITEQESLLSYWRATREAAAAAAVAFLATLPAPKPALPDTDTMTTPEMIREIVSLGGSIGAGDGGVPCVLCEHGRSTGAVADKSSGLAVGLAVLREWSRSRCGHA